MAFGEPVLAAALAALAAAASGGGVSVIGMRPLSETSSEPMRYKVDLDWTGQCSVAEGLPGRLRSMTLWSSSQRAGQVIVREITFPDGGASILITAASSFSSAVESAWLYLDGEPVETVLLQHTLEGWKERRPVRFRSSTAGGTPCWLNAFQVDELGLYHVVTVPGRAARVPPIVPEASAEGLVGGGLGRGLAHVTWALGALGAVLCLSAWAHTKQASRR